MENEWTTYGLSEEEWNAMNEDDQAKIRESNQADKSIDDTPEE